MRPGDVIAERFEVQRLAGSGGMGAVYRALDRYTGGPVALKILRGGKREDEQRLAREASTLADLDHPAVIRYLGHGLTDTGEPFLITEWLEGEDLGQRLARSELSMQESVTLARHVAEALGAAHAHGFVHRDIKPANVFLLGGRVDDVRVLDFGIARSMRSTGIVTRTGVLIGTLGYMAPEQARGTHQLDLRTDIFALGCILFECLTGRPVFAGEAMLAVIVKILFEEAPRVRDLRADLPAALDNLVARMLSKDPAGRPQDALQVARELGAILDAAPQVEFSVPRPLRLTSEEMRPVSVVIATVPSSPEAGPAEESAEESAAGRQTGGTLLFERISAAVAPLGATLERLPDGSMVATLVAQGSATEQAVRAARTALAMRAALPAAALVLATGRGSTEGRMPVGEVIDRAIGLLPSVGDPWPAPQQQEQDQGQGHHRGPWPVRIDAVTAGFLDARFEIGQDAQGRLELRGEREATDAAERGERGRRLLGKPTLCVGRERELALLGAYFQECTQEMVARTILVTGDPGVGKSRLGDEFLHDVRRTAVDAEIWIAQGSPLGAGSPLGMVGQLLRRAAGVREGEPLELRRRKLRTRLGRLDLGADEARVTEFIGEMAGAPFDDQESVQLRAARSDGQLMRDQMRQAWCDLLAAETAVHPVIVVLEDLHWGDLPSIQWLDVALRNLQERPLLVLALARPEVHDRFPKLWLERGRQEIRLGQLPRKASERLVRQVLGEAVEKHVVEQVIRQAAGNAFFLEELIRAIAEGQQGVLPETVLATVQVRLEALPAEARRLVRAASIFGETFWRGGLAVLLGQGRATASLEAQLEVLVNQELIAPNAEGRFPGEPEYRFRHAFVREAAYAMLTENDRTLGHRLAGEWLEQAGEQDALVLAVHFEYGKQTARAAAFYHRAAAEANQASDLVAALERGERAVLCGATGELLGQVRLIQSEAHHWRGDFNTAARDAAEALRLIPRESLPWFRAVALAAETAFMRGDIEGAATLSGELDRALPGTPADSAQLAAVAAATKNLLYVGRLASTRRLVQQLEAAIGTLAMNEPLAAGYVYDTLCYHAGIMGDPAAAHAATQEGIASYRRAGDGFRVDKMRLQAALVAIRLGRQREIQVDLRVAIERFQRLGIQALVVWAQYILGTALLRSGALEEAQRQIEETMVGLEAGGNSLFMARTRHVLAHILLERGRLAEAEVEARQAAEGGHYAAALAMLARVLLRRGQLEPALAAAREAWVALMHLGATLEDGGEIVPLTLAEALAATGDHEGARRVIGAARERLRTLAERMEPSLRQSFLEEVAENARTLELARAWLGD